MSLAHLKGTGVEVGAINPIFLFCNTVSQTSNGGTYNCANQVAPVYLASISPSSSPVTPFLVTMTNVPQISFSKMPFVTLFGSNTLFATISTSAVKYDTSAKTLTFMVFDILAGSTSVSDYTIAVAFL